MTAVEFGIFTSMRELALELKRGQVRVLYSCLKDKIITTSMHRDNYNTNDETACKDIKSSLNAGLIQEHSETTKSAGNNRIQKQFLLTEEGMKIS